MADRRALIDALSITPDYLRNRASESGEVIDYRDWHVPLGRRFRSLKLWFVIRHYGVEGLRRHVRAHVAAGAGAAVVDRGRTRGSSSPRRRRSTWSASVTAGGDAANQTLLERLNASGRLYLTSTRLDGKLTLRLSIGQTSTERRHVEAAWKRIRASADQLATAS